jgi:hypothetical protein
MVSRRFAKVLAGFGLAGALLAGAASAQAEDYKAGQIEISQVWARPSTVGNGAAYFQLTNQGTSGDALNAVESPVADKAELHTMTMDGNVMRMRKVPSLALPAGKSVSVAPGGLHVMLIGLKKPLVEGESFPMRLVFERAGSVEVKVHVEAKPPMMGGAVTPQGQGQMMDRSQMTMPSMSGVMPHP